MDTLYAQNRGPSGVRAGLRIRRSGVRSPPGGPGTCRADSVGRSPSPVIATQEHVEGHVHHRCEHAPDQHEQPAVAHGRRRPDDGQNRHHGQRRAEDQPPGPARLTRYRRPPRIRVSRRAGRRPESEVMPHPSRSPRRTTPARRPAPSSSPRVPPGAPERHRSRQPEAMPARGRFPGLTEGEAAFVEAAAIDLIGRPPLTNLVPGHHRSSSGRIASEDAMAAPLIHRGMTAHRAIRPV